MQLGIGTYTYGWAIGTDVFPSPEPMDELMLIARALSFGISLIQVGDNLPLHTFSSERLAHFKRLADNDKIEIEVGAKGLTANHLQTYISIASFLQARILRFVVDDENYKPSVEEIIKVIQECLPLLKKHGVILALENHDRFRAETYATIIKTIGSENVGICLDSVNSMGAGEGLQTVVETLSPYTVNLHIKDYGIERLPHKMGFIIDGRIAGQGMLPIPWLVENVSRFGKCKSAILEQWVVPESDASGSIIKEKNWAEQSVTYLQTLQPMGLLSFS